MDIDKIRNDFPILREKIYDKQLVYFDNAATTQKPVSVIDKISEVYKKYNSNVHRGVHYLSDESTRMLEGSRDKVRKFINAESEKEIIFTRGTTESVNLIAQTYAEKFLKEGDEIIITEMEHHSNFVPWQLIAERYNVKLNILGIEEDGSLSIEKLKKLINKKTKLLSITHVSNVLGTINPIKEIIKIFHNYDIPVFLDAAQSIQHLKIDVKELDCDFMAFSSHKLYGPTGIGIIYGKEKWLEELPPYQSGGEMIESVSIEKTYYNDLPFKFEAGTPNYVGAIGMGEAIDYVNSIGLKEIAEHEKDVFDYAMKKMKEIEGIKFYGTAGDKISVISFLIEGIHPYDLGTMMDKTGIAIRTGHHCAEPVMRHYNIPGTIRASFGMYNTKEEVDYFIKSINKLSKILR